MTLVRYQNPIPQVFNRFFDTEFDSWLTKNYSETNTTLPAVNIKETDNAYLLDFAAPGYKKDDFIIEINNDVLTVSSEKKIENVEEDENFTKKEFSYESFTRSFNLPELVEGDKIKATYKNGILEIKIPKKEEAKPKPVKQIKVS
jgi:HSP20 family protein